MGLTLFIAAALGLYDYVWAEVTQWYCIPPGKCKTETPVEESEFRKRKVEMAGNKVEMVRCPYIDKLREASKKLLDIEIKHAIEAKPEVAEMFGVTSITDDEYVSPVLVPENKISVDGGKERSVVKFLDIYL